jgi:hypothetical protein
MGDLLQRALPVDRLVVAIDPGKVQNRVWLNTNAAGLLVSPLTLPVLRSGVDEFERLVNRLAGEQDPVIAIEATGGLHRAWTQELNRRFPDSVRLFAPSQTASARAQLGSRRFKTDDRDCAALTYLARQGHGRPVPADEHEALLSAVRFRRGLLGERKAAQQRLHDQVNGLCPGLSAPVGHGRKLELELTSVVGQSFLNCLIDFGGRPAAARSLQARHRSAHNPRRVGSGRSGGRTASQRRKTHPYGSSAWRAASAAGASSTPTSPLLRRRWAGCSR